MLDAKRAAKLTLNISRQDIKGFHCISLTVKVHAPVSPVGGRGGGLECLEVLNGWCIIKRL